MRSPALVAKIILGGLVFQVAVSALAPDAQAVSMAERVREGNALYRKGQYAEALDKYTEVQVEHPDDPRFLYNVANAKHKVEEYDDAITLYAKAALGGDPALEERCYYNIGNSLYRQGKLQEAIEYYQRALALDPDDGDAKYNLEFVREEIKRRINEQKKRQEEQGAQQPPPDQQESDQEQQPPPSGAEQAQQERQEDQEAQAADAGQEEQRKDQAQAQAAGGQDAEEQSRPGPAEREKPKGKGMSQREAELWLNSLEEEKDEALRQWFRALAGPADVRAEKDW